jgi:hypothetical protein
MVAFFFYKGLKCLCPSFYIADTSTFFSNILIMESSQKMRHIHHKGSFVLFMMNRHLVDLFHMHVKTLCLFKILNQ